jgi:hypothetical protein
MLFQVQKPDPAGIYWLDTVLTTFFNNLFSHMAFGNGMFPPEFEIVLNESPRTLESFRNVFVAYEALGAAERQAFQDLYVNHRDAINHFVDDGFDVVRIPNAQSEIWKSVKNLGKYLYSTTLNLVCFTSLANVNHSIDAHFQRFRELNGNVCCFCGLKEYEEEREIEDDEGDVQWRADYDHYLPKKHYPFYAVNFNNLFPMCHTCNSKAKGEIDTLYGEGGIRVLTFHPYLDGQGVVLVPVYDPKTRNWDLDYAGGNALNNRKIENWDRIFDVISRARKRMNDFCHKIWVAPLIESYNSAQEVRDKLNREIARCLGMVNIEREAYFKVLCYRELEKQDDDILGALLATVKETYGGVVADTIAETGIGL